MQERGRTRMGRFLVACWFAACCGGLSSCAHTTSQASRGDFSDHVLEPLASQLADEHIAQGRADITLTYLEREKRISEGRPDVVGEATIHGLGSLLIEPSESDRTKSLPVVEENQAFKDASMRRVQYEETLAWLETRRLPLKRELLDLLLKRTVATSEGFTVCVEGKQRQYQAVEGGRFTRLADGPGPCETTELQSLKRDAAN